MADSLKVRTAIGLCLIVAIASLMGFDHWSGHGYGAIGIAVLLVAAGLVEYGRMAEGAGPIAKRTLMVFGVAFVVLKGLAYELDERLHLLEAPLAMAFAYTVFFGCLLGSPSLDRFRGMTATGFGFFYIPLLAGFALDARFLPGVGEAAFYYVIAISKGTDIFAYYFGKTLGKRKIVPSVSPGKTGAGFVGALVGGAVITTGFAAWTPIGTVLPVPLAVGVGILMALVGISGDLIESFIKRSVAIKDSANLLPNFGGILDIIDSILIAAAPTYFLLAGLHRLNL